MHIPTAGRVLGIDWGGVRIGLALSDESQLIASPLETLVRRRGKRFPMPRFLELTRAHEPVGLVVGLPLDERGEEGSAAGAARELADLVARRSGLPVQLHDERMSTARALGVVRELDGDTRGRREEVDALAASVMLQHWLEIRRVTRGSGSAAPAILLALCLLGCGGAGSGPVERVLIPRGSSFGAVVDSLAAHGLAGVKPWTRLLGRLTGTDRTVKAGQYEFRRGASTLTVLRALREGAVLETRFTVPEGLTALEVSRLAEERLRIPRDSFLAAAMDTAWLETLGVDGRAAEGYLYPETYHFSGPVDARVLIAEMVAQFHERWDPAWDRTLAATGQTRHEVLTLASIVEGEAASDEERPIIAGVYANRLRIGMALQADPTVQYAIQQATGERKSRLFQKDYQTQSPYNTYLFPGLPPGPVGNPGRASIEAALQPADVPYLYFVARADGTHTFSRTYEEHLRAVARARRERANSDR